VIARQPPWSGDKTIRMSIECNCPFCPLVKAGVQVCDVRVRLLKTSYTINWNKVQDQEKYEILHDAFFVMALTARNNSKLVKPNTYLNYEDHEKSWNIDCIGKNLYKVCFHSKVSTESDPQ